MWADGAPPCVCFGEWWRPLKVQHLTTRDAQSTNVKSGLTQQRKEDGCQIVSLLRRRKPRMYCPGIVGMRNQRSHDYDLRLHKYIPPPSGAVAVPTS